jgi:ribonucleoside-diphosphate reductase beta chain
MGLFDEQVSRKPNDYPWTEKFIDAMHNGFWTDKEFSFSSDVQDFHVKLTPLEKQVVVRSLSMIGQVECAVKTFWGKLGENIPKPAFVDLGYVMANTEVIHGNAYERLLKVLGLEEAFEDNLKVPEVSGRVNYLKKHVHKYYKDYKKQYIYSLILFTAFVENVSLFSQFYIILWLGRYKNLLKDTNQQVSYTKQEELSHFLIGVEIINTLRKEYPEYFDEELETLVREKCLDAIEHEEKLVDWILGDYSGERLNAQILKDFVKQRMNESLEMMGFKPICKVSDSSKRDFEWFYEEVLSPNQTDFFYKRPVDYSKKSQSYDADSLF